MCATHLFQVGQSVKIVKELTGHMSDAVHKYQTMSDQQRMVVIKIIWGSKKENYLKHQEWSPQQLSGEDKFKIKPLQLVISINIGNRSCETEKSKEEIGKITQNAIKAVSAHKAKLKIEVELLE